MFLSWFFNTQTFYQSASLQGVFCETSPASTKKIPEVIRTVFVNTRCPFPNYARGATLFPQCAGCRLAPNHGIRPRFSFHSGGTDPSQNYTLYFATTSGQFEAYHLTRKPMPLVPLFSWNSEFPTLFATWRIRITQATQHPRQPQPPPQ